MDRSQFPLSTVTQGIHLSVYVRMPLAKGDEKSSAEGRISKKVFDKRYPVAGAIAAAACLEAERKLAALGIKEKPRVELMSGSEELGWGCAIVLPPIADSDKLEAAIGVFKKVEEEILVETTAAADPEQWESRACPVCTPFAKDIRLALIEKCSEMMVTVGLGGPIELGLSEPRMSSVKLQRRNKRVAKSITAPAVVQEDTVRVVGIGKASIKLASQKENKIVEATVARHGALLTAMKMALGGKPIHVKMKVLRSHRPLLDEETSTHEVIGIVGLHESWLGARTVDELQKAVDMLRDLELKITSPDGDLSANVEAAGSTGEIQP